MDIEELLKNAVISEDLTRAKDLTPARVADLLDLKMLDEISHGEFKTALSDIREEIESQVNELLVSQGLSAKEIGRLAPSLKNDAAALTHLKNLTSAIKLYARLRDEHSVDDDDEAIVDACNLVLYMARIKLQRDGVPLISRGLYASQVLDALNFWKKHRDSPEGLKERLWQDELAARHAVLSRVLGGHVVLMGEEQHVGVTGLDGNGDRITDYLFRHKITRNVTLVEIKTPSTPLLGLHYRDTYALSQALSGSIGQVLLQRSDFAKAYYFKTGTSKQTFEVAGATCVVIAGNADKELGSDEKKARAFEMHRTAVASGVKIITFDELYDQFALFHNMPADD